MLAKYGQDVILRRSVGTSPQTNTDCTIRAFVRGYKAEQLAGAVIQGDTMVIISGAAIRAAQWPGGEVVNSPPTALDRKVPRPNDKIIVEGRTRTVIASDPVYLDGALLRVNVQVRG